MRDARQPACCFTGHRPEKLPWGLQEDDPRCLKLKHRIDDAVELAYDGGYRYFICGMAMGCDLYFCESVLRLRGLHPEVILEAAIPCPGQCAAWPPSQQRRYAQLVESCDRRTLISQHYSAGCMLRRNRYMVDRSSLLIAVFDGTSGGTRYTLQYAMSRRIAIVDLPVVMHNESPGSRGF